uniref:Uncharacterized protein n=1 Tax=Daphnia magna TaxID=35525 RepID=A0A0P6HBK7_9CRUS
MLTQMEVTCTVYPSFCDPFFFFMMIFVVAHHSLADGFFFIKMVKLVLSETGLGLFMCPGFIYLVWLVFRSS